MSGRQVVERKVILMVAPAQPGTRAWFVDFYDDGRFSIPVQFFQLERTDVAQGWTRDEDGWTEGPPGSGSWEPVVVDHNMIWRVETYEDMSERDCEFVAIVVGDGTSAELSDLDDAVKDALRRRKERDEQQRKERGGDQTPVMEDVK